MFAVYVLFNEKIPNRQCACFREIDEMAVKFAPNDKRLEEFNIRLILITYTMKMDYYIE